MHIIAEMSMVLILHLKKAKTYSLNKLFPSSKENVLNTLKHELYYDIKLLPDDDMYSEVIIIMKYDFKHIVNIESILTKVSRDFMRRSMLEKITNHKEFYMAMTTDELAYIGR